MEAFQDNKALQELMQRSDFANRLNASKTSYSQMGIQLQTAPSEKCAFAECDGSGVLHYINWTKKADAIENPTKYYMKDHEIEWTEKCKCVDQSEFERKVTSSGIPGKYSKAKVHGFGIDCYKKSESQTAARIAKQMAINYVEKYKELLTFKKNGLYLYSTTKGSGKTRLASSIANGLIKLHKQSVLFLKATDISPQVRKTYKKDSESTEEDVLRAFRNVDVLIIDDLAVSTEKDFTEDLIGRILDHRMDKGAVTIITSNKTIDELKEHFPKGIIASRVKKMCYEVLMPEESVRDEEAEQENREFENLLFGKNEGA